MRELIERITNGEYKETLVKNEKYEVLFIQGINIHQYYIYRIEHGESVPILTINVYPHEKVNITFIPWGSPEVEEVEEAKEICKELYRDLTQEITS